MLISLSFFATRINELCLEESFAREVIAADSTVELEKEVRTLLIAEHCAQICSLMNHVYCVTQFIVATIQLESWHMEFVQWEKQNGTVLHNSTKQRKGRKKMSIAELAKQPIQPEPEIPRPVITAYCCHCKLAQEFAETSHEKGPPTFVPPLPQSRPLLPQLENSQQEIEEDRSGGDADEEDLEEDETAVARREFSHWFKDQRGENDDLSSATGSAAFETLRGGRMVPISEPCLSAFAISPSSRWQQYEQFRQCFRDPAENGLHTAEQEYQVSVRDFEEADMQSRQAVLENARVIALTATGCSNNQQLIKKLKPAVLLIEEAAEILEMQLLTCLTEGVEHIVLIGDHKQLQPQVEIFEYERKNHLNISMFERLVSNGSRPFPQTVLTIQRRMRPEISQLVRPIYTVPIIDRPTTTSVQSRHGVFYKENPPGFAKPIFWWLHSHSDEASGVGVSTMNTREIAMTKCILKVLVTQENVPMEDITVLSPYLGQVRELRKALRNEFGEVQVHTVDRFQGDENTIVILSMTRSRETAFVKKENRMCVALSRARRSLFVLSHSGLPEMAPHWKRAYETFEASGCVGSELPLQCPRHPESCSLLVAPDPEAKRPCNKFCGAVYACGHSCRKRCHPDPSWHMHTECTLPCVRPCINCGQRVCKMKCNERCVCAAKLTVELACSFCEEEEELRVKRGLGTKPVIERLTVLEMDDLARRVNASEEGYSWTVTQALRITNYRQYQRFIEARKKLEEPVSRTVFVICSVTDIKNIVVNGFSTQLGPYGSVVSAFTSLSQLPVVGASEAILLCDGAIGKCGPAPSPPVALHKRQMAECEFDTLLDATTHSFVFHFSERILPRFVMKVRRKHAPDYWLDWRLTGFALHPVSDAAIIDKWRAALMETQCCAKVPVTSVSVTRIENSSLWKTFCRKKDEIVERYSFAGVRDSTFPYEMHPLLSDCLDARVSEYYLFHGTTEECALQIAQTGFTEKLAKLEGLYGAGSYFAMNACKSMQYSSKPTRTFIVARVALGHPHIPTLRYKERILPWRDESAGLRYDSLLAVPGKSNNGQQRHHEFVIFDGAQTYPEFIIKFS
eukprot:TRINITY_DN9076_c0_g1_i5.p1 TRINITY_DN9076_c0_g1~~TRINITY_DN9076_c0_g1_i5.p1  ORF type:complete len:1081 (-),score=137.40 TRINITY_DN9076_c0_g1_i5:56-3298(-)